MKIFYCALLILMSILGLLSHFNSIDGNLLLGLRFERAGLENHEYWRLISGHLVHLTLPHLLMNMGAFALLLLMFWKDFSYRSDLMALIFSTFGVSFGLYFFNSELSNYVGFSGILHGLFLYYFLKTMPQNYTYSVFAISALIAKIAWEQTPWSNTSDLAELIGGSVATMAHLYGGVCGFISGCLILLLKKTP